MLFALPRTAVKYNAATGSVLGLVHSLTFIIRGRDVLSFPFIQRKRIFRVKQRLVSVAASAARTSVTAVILSAVLQRTMPHSFPHVTGQAPLLLLLLGASLLAFCWEVRANPSQCLSSSHMWNREVG
jgi:hypothetical protein